jgi:hypothetical protein
LLAILTVLLLEAGQLVKWASLYVASSKRWSEVDATPCSCRVDKQGATVTERGHTVSLGELQLKLSRSGQEPARKLDQNGLTVPYPTAFCCQMARYRVGRADSTDSAAAARVSSREHTGTTVVPAGPLTKYRLQNLHLSLDLAAFSRAASTTRELARFGPVPGPARPSGPLSPLPILVSSGTRWPTLA